MTTTVRLQTRRLWMRATQTPTAANGSTTANTALCSARGVFKETRVKDGIKATTNHKTAAPATRKRVKNKRSLKLTQPYQFHIATVYYL